MIAVFHLWAHYPNQPTLGGFVAVEFFFIVSGFLLMQKSDHNHSESPLSYTWNRVKKLYPHYIFSFLILFLYRTLIVSGDSPILVIQKLINQMTEIFMVYGTIVSDKSTSIYNSMTWYLSVMLIMGYILWGCLQKGKTKVLLVAPIFAFWIYAFMYYTLGTTNNWRTHVFEVFNYGFLRAAAGMLLGCSVFQVSVRLRQKWSHYHRAATVGFLLGCAVLGLAFVLSYKWYREASFFYIICFAIGVTFLTAAEATEVQLPAWLQGISKFVGKYSYAIYLNHYFISQILINTLFPKYQSVMILPYLVLLIVYSVFTTHLVQLVIECLKRIWKQFAAYLLAQST